MALTAVLRFLRCLITLYIPFAGIGVGFLVYARESVASPACAVEDLGPGVAFERARELAMMPSVSLLRLIIVVGVLPLLLQLGIELVAQAGNIPLTIPRISSVLLAICVAPMSSAAFGLAHIRIRSDLEGVDGELAAVFD